MPDLRDARRPVRGRVEAESLDYRPRSNEGFVEDLRTSRGVVAGGGFSLLSEAVYLGKPVLAIPLRGQFEQMMNARYLERDGYGLCAPVVTREILGEFLERLGEFERALAGYEQEGNSVTLKTIEQHAIAVAAAQPRQLRRERRGAAGGRRDEAGSDRRGRPRRGRGGRSARPMADGPGLRADDLPRIDRRTADRAHLRRRAEPRLHAGADADPRPLRRPGDVLPRSASGRSGSRA